jgi:hemolysin activation/secretion protein
MMDSGVKNGEPLNDGQLERSLLLINDLPGVTAKGTLERGAAAGSTRVLIDAVEGPLFSGGLSVDNFGNYYTGVWRGSGFASVNDPFGVGDRLSVSLTGEEKLHQEKIGYSSQLLPIGLTGNLSYTHLGYKLGEELKSLDAHGHADSITAGVGYPIVRRRAISLWANTGYEYRMMTDYAGGVETKDREINAGTAELYSSVYDRLGGGALTSFRLALLGGDLTLRNNTNSVIDGLTARTAGRYTKLNYTIERLQRLVPDISLFGSVNGQFADGNLDSSEKFSLGGPTGIRAYPVGEASGDEGHNFTVELRYDTPMPSSYGSLQLFGFCDSGIVTLNKNLWTNAVTTATGNNTYWISGTGLGLNYRKSGVLALSGTWAHTIGGNDGRSTNGKDSDNSSSNNRFWLQATVWF